MNDHVSNNVPVLEARNLTKSYEDGILALDHVSYTVEPGQIFTLLGGNGAGKTTTINLFLNMIEPSEGQAFINGYDATREPLKAKENVAFVSENVMLYSNFTVIQNLDFFARIGGKTEYDSDDYREVLNRVGLDSRFHSSRLKNLSKGMRQKCGIAIAILKDAPAILLDEPTSGLDPQAARDFIELLKTLKAQNKAILMSTHDIFRAKEVSDVVAIMDRGRVIMLKNAAEIAQDDLERLYLEHMSGRIAAVNGGGINA